VIVSKVCTGEYGSKHRASIWVEDKEGNSELLAQFVDEDAYMTFIELIEAGYFKPSNKSLPKGLVVDIERNRKNTVATKEVEK
jgi:hypothetical protein